MMRKLNKIFINCKKLSKNNRINGMKFSLHGKINIFNVQYAAVPTELAFWAISISFGKGFIFSIYNKNKNKFFETVLLKSLEEAELKLVEIKLWRGIHE